MTRALALALLALSGTAHADEVEVTVKLDCFPRGDVVAALASEGQAELGTGLHHSGKGVIELYTSPEGAFTIIASGADGLSCFLTDGEFWTEQAQGAPS